MKKYTNKILATGLLIVIIISIGWLVYVFDRLKINPTDNQEIDNPKDSTVQIINYIEDYQE